MNNELGLPRAATHQTTTRRRLTSLIVAVSAGIGLAIAGGGPALAGVLPPTCGTPNTPSCGVPNSARTGTINIGTRPPIALSAEPDYGYWQGVTNPAHTPIIKG